jgi:ankyrin repeat protein
MAQFLIERGAKLNTPIMTLFGMSPLEAAVSEDDPDMVKYLLTLGADVHDARALTAAARQEGDSECLSIILKATTDQSLRYSGCYALQNAIWTQNFPAIQLLLTAGASPNQIVLDGPETRVPEPDSDSGHDDSYYEDYYEYFDSRPQNISALGIAIQHDQTSDCRILCLLLDASGDPNSIVAHYPKKTALLLAVERGFLPLVQKLLEAGANVNTQAHSGLDRTPLQRASEKGHFDIVNLLLENGADVNAPPAIRRGATALQFASIYGYLSIVCVLLQAGADVNAPASPFEGRTALEAAAEHGRIDIIQLLLNSGVFIGGPGEAQYDRSIAFARANGHNAAGNLIESYWAQWGLPTGGPEILGEVDLWLQA